MGLASPSDGFAFIVRVMNAVPPSKKRAVYTIPAGVPFATRLVQGITMLVDDDPSGLARALILVPSRRAARSLRLAFLEVHDDKAMLLPRMLPIGDVDEDDPTLLDPGLAEPELLAAETDAFPPAINPLRRQMLLARLLENFPLGGQLPTFGQAMILAQSLADLLDQVGMVGADLSQIRDILPEQFSRHWQDILKLLDILIDRWPDILAAEGVMDPVARREMLARARLTAWQQSPPEGIVIIAGSTGTFATTRELIACVAALPRGYVIVPGLDRGATEHWTEIESDTGHPQHQLAQLLSYLEMPPDQVQTWPMPAAADQISVARGEIMREVFAPAALTTKWRQLPADRPDISADCLHGLRVVACKDVNSEADVIALSLRETLETPKKTAALVTPDRSLAEAVIVALRRWNIHVDDSAGTPLSQCGAGVFLQLLANAVAADFVPVSLLSLLKHPLAAGGMELADFRFLVRSVELAVLRGHRPTPGLTGLIDGLEERPDLAAFVRDHVRAPLQDLAVIWKNGTPSLAGLASALATAGERLAARTLLADGTCDADDGALHLWRDFDGEAAAEVMRDLAEQTTDIGIDPAEFPHILDQIFADKPVRRRWPLHPRLAVLGPVEARMQSADRLIIGGFNEGNWPPKPESDPWMNAEMRRVIDLPARNWRTGLSAHDVFMAICAPEVIVTRSLRQAGTATIPSRWLQRFDAVLTSLGMNSALDRGHASLSWLAQLTPTPEVKSVSRPVPVPPLATRPRKFSATEVDSWIADPYGIYAKKILKLRQLDDLDRAPDAALRGNLFHDALAIFINRFPSGPLPDNALAELSAIGKDVFASQWQNPGVQFFWWPRFMAVAKWFVSQEQVRRQNITHSYAEVKGEIVIEGPAGPVKFTVRADRLDLDETGMWHVIDYKTGSAPSATKVAKGRRTQLLIEALIAAEGGFESLSAGEVGAMEYWQLSGARGKIAVPTNVMPDDWQPTDTRTHLSDLVKLFDDPATPYPSEPDIKQRPAFSPYRHLARVAEWQAEDGDE